MSYYFEDQPSFIGSIRIQLGVDDYFYSLLAETYELVSKFDGMCHFILTWFVSKNETRIAK